MRQPLEDPLTKWKREADEQEARFAEARAKRARAAEPAPVNWDSRIANAVADERGFMTELLAEAIVELNERQREAIDAALQPLRIELAELKAANAEAKVANAELRLVNASLREQVSGHSTTIDLPALLPRGSRAN